MGFNSGFKGLSNTSLGTVKYDDSNTGAQDLFDCNSAQNESWLGELFSEFLVYPCSLTSVLSFKPDIGSGVKLQRRTELVTDSCYTIQLMYYSHFKTQ